MFEHLGHLFNAMHLRKSDFTACRLPWVVKKPGDHASKNAPTTEVADDAF